MPQKIGRFFSRKSRRDEHENDQNVANDGNTTNESNVTTEDAGNEEKKSVDGAEAGTEETKSAGGKKPIGVRLAKY